MKYVTRYERFILGDFPMVCARSGLPATMLVPVETRRASLWPWLFFPRLGFQAAGIGVILWGVHPEFVRATRQAQGKAT